MSSSNYRFTLDMQSNQSQVSLPVRLGDTNRKLYIIITNGGTPFILEDGFRAVLFGRKADGKTLNNDCIIENKSTIRYDFTPNTASASGVVDCELRVYDAQGELVTTPRFILVVDERVLYDDDIVSESDRSALDAIYGSETARENAEKQRAEAEASRKEAETARATAESNRDSAETSRTTAEKARDSAETLRGIAETSRVSNESNRDKAETARQVAERERELASAIMTAMFNIISGNNESHNVDTLDAVPNYIFNNLDKFNEGDVIIIGNNGFDLVCMGSATQEEMRTNGYYTVSDILFGGITIEAGGAYIFADGSGVKFVATSVKFKLPIGQEELDAHNSDDESHQGIREELALHKHEYESKVNSLDSLILNQKSELSAFKEETANAIKGKISGEVVRVSDVSPIEHTVKCKVKSKNLFNNLLDYKLATDASYTYVNGTLTVVGQYANKNITVSEGETYTFSCKSTRTGTAGGGIYIRAYTEDLSAYVNLFSAMSELSQVATVTVPKGYPILRLSFYGDSSGGTGTSTYTEIMLEKNTAATGYVPYVDPATATVTRCGKNLLPVYPNLGTKTINGIKFTVNADKSVTCSGTATANARFNLTPNHKLPSGNYVLRGCPTSGSENVRLQTNIVIDGAGTTGTVDKGSGGVLTVPDNCEVYTYIVIIAGQTVTNATFSPMLQLEADTDTTYEIPVVETYTPTSDGTVEGIKSVAPTMTLLTDTANVVVEIEYNQDINVLNKRLVEALDAIIKIQDTLIGGTSQ